MLRIALMFALYPVYKVSNGFLRWYKKLGKRVDMYCDKLNVEITEDK